MDTRCKVCGREVAGGEMTVWHAGSGPFRVETYLDDLRTSEATVMHPRCFTDKHGAATFVELAQKQMIDLASSLNKALLHIYAQNDELRKHRLEPPELEA